MSRRTLGVAIGLVFFGGVGDLTYRVVRPPAAVTLDQALARFRGTSATADPAIAPVAAASSVPSSSATVAASKPKTGSDGRPANKAARGVGLSPSGVYVYDTDGYEATDALAGSRHDYPKSTTVILQRSACGSTARWSASTQRWDETSFCNESGGVAMRKFVSHHEFFGKEDTQTFTCGVGSLVYRFPGRVGEDWKFECRSRDGKVDSTVETVGIERLLVGGELVETVHLHYVNTLTGRNRGGQSQHRWLEAKTGLLVKMTQDGSVTTESPFGTINYEEHYVLSLTSMTPRR